MSGRSEVVSSRFTVDEMAELDRVAAEHGRTRSEMCHDLAVAAMLRMRPGVEVRRLPSGAELTVWPNPTNDPIGVT